MAGTKKRAAAPAGDTTTEAPAAAPARTRIPPVQSDAAPLVDEIVDIEPIDGPDEPSPGESWEDEFEEVGAPRVPVHQTRAAMTREHEIVHPLMDDFEFNPANLTAPPPREGMAQRWIRWESAGANDGQNVSRRMRQGWTPRDPNTIPAKFNLPPTKGKQNKGAGVVAVQGMVLCEMPIELAERYRAHNQAKQRRMEEGVDADIFRVQAPGHKILRQSKSQVAVGRRRPPVAP